MHSERHKCKYASMHVHTFTLQYNACHNISLRYTILHDIALHYIARHCIALCCSILHYAKPPRTPSRRPRDKPRRAAALSSPIGLDMSVTRADGKYQVRNPTWHSTKLGMCPGCVMANLFLAFTAVEEGEKMCGVPGAAVPPWMPGCASPAGYGRRSEV